MHTDGSGVTSWRTIDQVGTISSGTWNGAIIGVPYGGTGTATGSIDRDRRTLTLRIRRYTIKDIIFSNCQHGTGQTIIKNAVINESANDYSLPTVRGTNGQFLQTDGSGAASWATLTASNGLTKTVNDIELGGTLTENTAVAQAGFNMIYNLTGAGDFAVQDNGTDVFKVSGDGSV